MTTIAILQPGYLPWLGFFDLLKRSDIFIYYDDVQYDKHGWRNRNRIRTPNGVQWLTVPVLHKSLGKPEIRDIQINNQGPWARKHIGSIEWSYSNAPFFTQYSPEIRNLLGIRWDKIVDLAIESSNLISKWLGIKREIYRSSALDIKGGKSERLVKFCKHFGADRYLTGDSAKNYLDVQLFAENDIEIEWQQYRHPTYQQQNGEFIPYLSALDLVLNVGGEAANII